MPRPNRSVRWGLLVAGIALVGLLARPAWTSYRVQQAFRESARAHSNADSSKAVEVLEPLLQFAADRADVRYRLGVAYRRYGMLPQANEQLDLAERMGWPAEDITRQRTLMPFQIGKTEGARDYLISLKDKDVSDEAAEEVYEALAQGYLTAFEIMDAEECLGHWLDWKPDSIVAHFWLAQVRERTDNLEGALKELRTVVQYAPDHLQGRLRLARILLKSGQVEESLTEYSRCLEVAPDDASVLLAVADCQLRLGNMEQATKLLYTVLEVEDLPPGLRSTAQSELGRLALEEGRVDEALERLQEGVQLSPRNSGIRYSYGLALAKAGRAEEAKKEFDKSTQLTEQFGTLIDLSRELFRKPKDVEVRRKIGEGLYDLGYIDEAAGWLRTVIWIDPTDAHSHRLLAEYYEKRGDHERSIHHLQVAEGKAVSIPSDGLDPAHLGPSAELSFENESLDARPKLDGR